MRERNRSLSAGAKAAASLRIFERIEAMPSFRRAGCVALFCALPDEPPTQEALARWGREKRIVVPRVEGDTMRFFDYDPATLVRGAFGIGEPGPEAALCRPEEIDLIVVPGVAFTAGGARLGRGKGYYDRYFALPGMRALRIGVCFAHQLVDRLPVEPHDAAMEQVCAG